MSDEIKKEIMQRVQIDPETGCWNWTGTITRSYPFLNTKPRGISVRRYLFGIYYGEVFDKLIHVHVTCGNKLCVCPDHLTLQRSGKVGGFAKLAELRKQRTHCNHGHSLEDAYIDKSGFRSCRTCRSIRNARRYKPKCEEENHE